MPRYWRICSFPGFETCFQHSLFSFYNFGCYFESIFGTVGNILAKTFILWPINRFYDICCRIFRFSKVILIQLVVYFSRYGRKHSFASFETYFTTFAVLYLALWRFLKVDRRYHCHVTRENIHSSASKPVLRHQMFYFQNYRGYFELIKCTVSKNLAKMFIRRLMNRFYSFCFSIFRNLEVILSRYEVPLQKTLANKFICRLRNRFYVIRIYIFRTLVVYLSLSEVSIPGYWRIRSFTCFKTGFMAFAFNFLKFGGYFESI